VRRNLFKSLSSDKEKKKRTSDKDGEELEEQANLL
jgi:hypothetical protein